MEKYQYNNQCFEAMRFTGSKRSAIAIEAWVNLSLSEEDTKLTFTDDGSGDVTDMSLLTNGGVKIVQKDQHITKDKNDNFCAVSREVFNKNYRIVTYGMKWSN